MGRGDDTDAMAILTKVGRGLIVGLATTFLLGLLSGLGSMGPDLDHIPYKLSILFPEVYGRFREVPPRFLHQVFFRSFVATTIIMAAFAGRCLMAVIKEVRSAHAKVR